MIDVFYRPTGAQEAMTIAQLSVLFVKAPVLLFEIIYTRMRGGISGSRRHRRRNVRHARSRSRRRCNRGRGSRNRSRGRAEALRV